MVLIPEWLIPELSLGCRVALEGGERGDLIRNKGEGNYTITKRSILQEDKIILPVFGPNNKASKYVKQKLINLIKEMD